MATLKEESSVSLYADAVKDVPQADEICSTVPNEGCFARNGVTTRRGIRISAANRLASTSGLARSSSQDSSLFFEQGSASP
jgi:hypothetical protein